MSGKPLNVDFYRGWVKGDSVIDGGRVHFRAAENDESGILYMEIYPDGSNLGKMGVTEPTTIVKRNINSIYVRNPADVAKGSNARYGSKVARRHFERLDVRSNQIWVAEMKQKATNDTPYLVYELKRVGDTGSNACNSGYAKYGKDAMFVSINVVGKEEKIV